MAKLFTPYYNFPSDLKIYVFLPELDWKICQTPLLYLQENKLHVFLLLKVLYTEEANALVGTWILRNVNEMHFPNYSKISQFSQLLVFHMCLLNSLRVYYMWYNGMNLLNVLFSSNNVIVMK